MINVDISYSSASICGDWRTGILANEQNSITNNTEQYRVFIYLGKENICKLRKQLHTQL
jgi:hypothetical protein